MLKSYRDHSAHSWIVGMESFETIASYSEDAVKVLRNAIERHGISLIAGKSELPYDAFFDAMPPTHLQFFNELQRYYRDDRVVCVHGGLDTDDGDFELQHPDIFLWGSEAFPAAYARDESVVYGHHNNAVLDRSGWPHPNIKPNRTYGIDTIAYGVLTGIRFPGGDIFQSKQFKL
jgi:diadenosine tetraphosphatase ApaH/serine/threonine PP2A family protein phosphatase